MNKGISIILAVILVFSFSVGGFTKDEEKFHITTSRDEGGILKNFMQLVYTEEEGYTLKMFEKNNEENILLMDQDRLVKASGRDLYIKTLYYDFGLDKDIDEYRIKIKFTDGRSFTKDFKRIDLSQTEEALKFEEELRFVIDPGGRSRDKIVSKVRYNDGETIRTVTDRAINQIKKADDYKDIKLTFSRDGMLTTYDAGRNSIYRNDIKEGYEWRLELDGMEIKSPGIEKLRAGDKEIVWFYDRKKVEEKEDNKDKENGNKQKEKEENQEGSETNNRTSGNILDRSNSTPYINGYKDQTFKPNRNAKREEVAAMIYKVIDGDIISRNKTSQSFFTDVPDYKWSLEYISTLSNMNLINGYKDGSFRPGNSITRAETVAIVARAAGVEEANISNFVDTKGHWAEDLINGVAEKGWLSGYGNGEFRPNDLITRAELVTVINNALERPKKLESINRFTDVNSFNWYYDEVMKAASF